MAVRVQNGLKARRTTEQLPGLNPGALADLVAALGIQKVRQDSEIIIVYNVIFNFIGWMDGWMLNIMFYSSGCVCAYPRIHLDSDSVTMDGLFGCVRKSQLRT